MVLDDGTLINHIHTRIYIERDVWNPDPRLCFCHSICPGMFVANQALFINIVTVLWAVNIEKASDASGEPILPSRTDCVDESIVV